MKGLYIMESKLTKIHNELKIGKSENFKDRNKSFRTLIGNPEFTKIYLIHETYDKIGSIEVEVLGKTKHLKSELFGSEFRKIPFEEMDKIIIDTLKHYAYKYDEITKDIMFKVKMNSNVSLSEVLPYLALYYKHDFNTNEFITKVQKQHSNMVFIRNTQKESIGGNYMWFLPYEMNENLIKWKKKILEHHNKNIQYIVSCLYICNEQYNDHIMLIINTQNKTINYYITSEPPIIIHNNLPIIIKIEPNNIQKVLAMIKNSDEYKDYTIGYTGKNIYQEYSKNLAIIDAQLDNAMQGNIKDAIHKSLNIQCCYYFLYQVITQQFDIEDHLDMIMPLIKYVMQTNKI